MEQNKFTCYGAGLLALLNLLCCTRATKNEHKDSIYHHAVVVSASEYASKVGAQVMRQGGNAIDAAVAVSFALAVVYPSAGNIGGGGFMVLRLINGENNTLDFREKAPSSATRNMYLDAAGSVIPD